jgi:hypothetical protein
MCIWPDTDLSQVYVHLTKLLNTDRDDAALTIIMDLVSPLHQNNNKLQLRIHQILTRKYRKKMQVLARHNLSYS